MNISGTSLKHADACRFCWMCHHICPVGNATGQERNTARSRGLALSLVAREGAEVSADMIDNMYECTLCGGCTTDCVTGWDPIIFVKDVRAQAALEGLLPPYIEKMIENFENTGNIYGVKTFCDDLKAEISNFSAKTKRLLFLGADARFTNCTSGVKAIKVMKKIGEEFTVLENEPDSGYSFDTIIGAVDETVSLMKECASVLNEYDEIIVFDPADAKTFIREYKEYGVELTCKIVTFTSLCASAIENGSLKVNKTNKTYTYQDPALLAREVGELESPRQIIKACGELKEMLINGKAVMFAGNTLMSEYIPDTMKLIAKERWESARSTGATALVTASVSEYAVLKSVKPQTMELLAIEDLLL